MRLESTNKLSQKIPTRCYMCSVGIGVSTINGKPHYHEQTDPVIVALRGKEIMLCDFCAESLKNIKDKDRYIAKLRYKELV